jgi:hypothetical protein
VALAARCFSYRSAWKPNAAGRLAVPLALRSSNLLKSAAALRSDIERAGLLSMQPPVGSLAAGSATHLNRIRPASD